jgi:L-amino acid N-acyltransferase YncA
VNTPTPAGSITWRAARPEDAAAMLAIYGPVVRDSAISFEFEPPSLAEFQRRIESVLPVYPWLVAERDGQCLGYGYATRFRTRAAYDWSAETAVYVAEGARRSGVGRGLAVLDWLERLGHRCAVAVIALPNDPSRALHEAVGYRSAGTLTRGGYKFGRWHPIEFFECALGPEEPPPEGPDPFGRWVAPGEQVPPPGALRAGDSDPRPPP